MDHEAMDDELKLGLNIDIDESENTKTGLPFKRKADDDILSLPNLKNDKRKRVLKGLKSHEVREILKTDPFKFCQDMGLVAKTTKCSCNESMKLMSYPQTNDVYLWRCRKNGHSTSISIRNGTFFEGSRLSLSEILWMAYMWLYEYSMQSMLHECDHTYNTISEWCASCVRLCREILEHKCYPVGGDQKTVEVFECNFPKKKHSENDSKWVFCSLEYDGSNSLVIIMEDKTSESIMKVLDKHVLPGTILVSYAWGTFKNLTYDNFHYLRNEKSISFYNLWTKMKMDTFLDFEYAANQKIAGKNTWHKSVYDESFFEKMYRRSLLHASDAYQVFLKDIALVYKPTDVYVKSSFKIEPK